MLASVFPKIDYLDFMGRWSGKVRYDLASSGISSVPAAKLGTVAVDDFGSRPRFAGAVARHYDVPEQEVVPCLGTSGALFTAYGAVLGPRDRVLVERPSYEPLWRIAQGLGRGVDFFDRASDAGFRVSVERVLAALQPETRLVVITNPHNPTGALTEDETLTELSHELALRNAWLLVDEAYLETARPGASARKLGSRILTCASTTKCWGVPWARAGWLLLPGELVTSAARVERCTMNAAPPASWAWGERVIERQAELRSNAERSQSGKRALVDDFVARNTGRLHWCPPPATSPFGWLRDNKGRTLRPMLDSALETYGLFVAPGEFFGDDCALRLGWTSDLETLTQGLSLLERILPA